MPSPFPGMNPYLEQEGVWQDFHVKFLTAINERLVPQVRPRYIVKLEEHIYVHELPPEPRRLVGRADLSVAALPPATEGRGGGAILEAPTQIELAVQDVIRRDGLLANVVEMGARLERCLNERFGQHPFVGDIRGRGLFWALELVSDRAGKRPFDPAAKLPAHIKREAMALGLMVYPMGGTVDGVRGDHVLLAPPFIIEAAQVDAIVDRLGAALEAALADLR